MYSSQGGTQGESLDPQTIISRLLVFTAVTVCLVVLTKWYFGGGVCRSKARLDGKNECKFRREFNLMYAP